MVNEKAIKKVRNRFGELLFISLIVSIKLLLSYFFPGLKTPGELVWTGGALLFYTIRSYIEYRNFSNLL